MHLCAPKTILQDPPPDFREKSIQCCQQAKLQEESEYVSWAVMCILTHSRKSEGIQTSFYVDI
jgi:hypothetical protein